MSLKKKDIKELTTEEKLDLIIELLHDVLGKFYVSVKTLEDKPKDPPPTPPNG